MNDILGKAFFVVITLGLVGFLCGVGIDILFPRRVNERIILASGIIALFGCAVLLLAALAATLW